MVTTRRSTGKLPPPNRRYSTYLDRLGCGEGIEGDGRGRQSGSEEEDFEDESSFEDDLLHEANNDEDQEEYVEVKPTRKRPRTTADADPAYLDSVLLAGSRKRARVSRPNTPNLESLDEDLTNIKLNWSTRISRTVNSWMLVGDERETSATETTSLPGEDSSRPSGMEQDRSRDLPRAACNTASLMLLPFDIFYEVIKYTKPMDFLNLTRTAKDLRALFMSRDSRPIWVATFRNVPGLPPCPPDISEPHYVSFIFETQCEVCGIDEELSPNFRADLRVRLCIGCMSTNVVRGSTIAKPFGKKMVDDLVIYNLLPWQPAPLKFSDDPVQALKYRGFFKPDFVDIVAKYAMLQKAGNTELLHQFVEGRKKLTTQIREHAVKLTAWYEHGPVYRRPHLQSRMREQGILWHLQRLGYTAEDLANRHDDYSKSWCHILYQSRKLTPKVWKAVQPKLIEIIHARREIKKLEFLEKKLTKRRKEALVFYDDYIKSLNLSDGERAKMPNLGDLCKLPPLAEVIALEEGERPVTLETWNAVLPELLQHIEEYKVGVEVTLGKIVAAAASEGQPVDGVVGAVNTATRASQSDSIGLLKRASVFFQCSKCMSVGPPFVYPDVLSHGCVQQHSRCGTSSWSGIRPIDLTLLEHHGLASRTAETLLQRMGFSETTTLTEVVSLGSVFVCRRCHITARKFMTWSEVVTHFVDENKWYTLAQRCMVQLAKNKHDTEDDSIAVVCDGEISDPSEPPVPHVRPPKRFAERHLSCKVCFKSGLGPEGLSYAQMLVHLAEKHGEGMAHKGNIKSKRS